MREIQAVTITDAVRRMCIKANCELPDDVRKRISAYREHEDWEPASATLGKIIENYEIAGRDNVPICQDTGVACVFVEIGQDVRIIGDLSEAINEGVRQGYDIVSGDKLKITVAPKGFGSENMSRINMLRPYDGIDGVKAFVLKTVEEAGANPCPPIIVGVGIGGTFDKAALLAKKALFLPVDKVNEDPFYANLEDELLKSINALGIGPQGFGGRTTALAVKILTMPTHIAGLPVAVNINCHVARHVSGEL
jgi:fumarate hydratase subunit alpha